MKTHLKELLLLLGAGILVLSACQPASQPGDAPLSEYPPAQRQVAKLDQSQPDDFATATFSLG